VNHGERGLLELGEVALGRVFDQQALVAAIVGFAHRRLHADFRRDAGQQEMRDALRPEQVVELGGVEGTLARLDDDRFARAWGKLRHDVVAGLTVDQDAAHRARIPDPQRRPASLALGRRAVGEIGAVAFARVDDANTVPSRPREQVAHGRDDRGQATHVVAERFAEAAALDEIALHVDHDQRRGRGLERVGVRPRRDLRHGRVRAPAPPRGVRPCKGR
jgi:hypothetical protein